jgi:hypothetical protein
MTAILVRNTQPGPTTLTPSEGSSEYLVWQGAGDPDGQDVQLVSEAAVASIPFQRAVARQLLAIEGQDAPELDPAVQAYLDRQAGITAAARARAEADLDAKIDKAEDRVLHGVPCVGPDTRGTGTCDTLVSVPGKNRDLAPPLCTRHKPLALQYVAEVVEDGESSRTKWVRTTMAPREKGSAR